MRILSIKPRRGTASKLSPRKVAFLFAVGRQSPPPCFFHSLPESLLKRCTAGRYKGCLGTSQGRTVLSGGSAKTGPILIEVKCRWDAGLTHCMQRDRKHSKTTLRFKCHKEAEETMLLRDGRSNEKTQFWTLFATLPKQRDLEVTLTMACHDAGLPLLLADCCKRTALTMNTTLPLTCDAMLLLTDTKKQRTGMNWH